MDLPAAEKAIRQGSNLGFLLAILPVPAVIVAITTDLGVAFDRWNDPWVLLDAAIVAGLAFGVRRRSRTCAVGLTVFYVLTVIFNVAEEGRAFCIVVPAILTYYFAKSIEGTFFYHKLRGEQDPEYRATARWTYWLLIPGTVVGALFLVFAVVGSFMLPAAVIAGDEMNPRHTALLRERGVLLENERVVMFYSAALFSILSDGNMLTDDRVVSYETIDDKLMVYDAAYNDIVEVTVLSEGGSFEVTTIGVTTATDESFIVLAGTEAGGDKRFLADLESRIGHSKHASLME
jgi:serine/threonine-protein kinase